MLLTTDKFQISSAQKLYAPSREIRSDRQVAMPSVVGVESLEVSCLACTHAWTATRTNRTLVPAIGTVVVRCPECRATETIDLRNLIG
jgi:hypothetical protein